MEQRVAVKYGSSRDEREGGVEVPEGEVIGNW
jgi:hypothetical protein